MRDRISGHFQERLQGCWYSTKGVHQAFKGPCPILEVLAELQDSEAQDFAKFQNLVCVHFAVTQEFAQVHFWDTVKEQRGTFAQAHCRKMHFLDLWAEEANVTTVDQWKQLVVASAQLGAPKQFCDFTGINGKSEILWRGTGTNLSSVRVDLVQPGWYVQDEDVISTGHRPPTSLHFTDLCTTCLIHL